MLKFIIIVPPSIPSSPNREIEGKNHGVLCCKRRRRPARCASTIEWVYLCIVQVAMTVKSSRRDRKLIVSAERTGIVLSTRQQTAIWKWMSLVLSIRIKMCGISCYVHTRRVNAYSQRNWSHFEVR